jgi:serine/tyrosine/threonine adenylyltransferase
MKFSDLNFQNHFEKLGDDFSKKCLPTSLQNQEIIAISKSAADLIDLDISEINLENFSNSNFCNISQAYAGHQFGHFVPSLGDGRAVLLTQVTNQKNESWDLVLKGSGITPFSRPYVQNADGRAVLRSSIREFLISEHMAALGIPTSRALCLISSDELVMREMPEKAAQIIRLAPSHIRFGTFEYFFYRQDYENVKKLADYCITNYFSSCKNYSEFLSKIVESTAKMIAKWQAFGFCHGVLNTDNMSIHGITFDYGPFGFLDEYNPHHICNHSDQTGRYSFINQPQIGFWNLNALAITFSNLIAMEEIKEILENYQEIFLKEYHQLMAAKLGFERVDEDVKKEIYQTLNELEKEKKDYTQFFYNLTINTSDLQKRSLMKANNPKFILRNHLLQVAIKKAENGDFSEIKKLQEITSQPFETQLEFEEYSALPPSWAKDLCISCSS